MAWGCSVREMLSRVDAEDLTELAALWRIDPWGGVRADWQAASIAACVVNMLRGDGKRASVADLLLEFGKPPRPPETPEQKAERQKRAFRLWARACGGKVEGA
jgi:hypothetical protein